MKLKTMVTLLLISLCLSVSAQAANISQELNRASLITKIQKKKSLRVGMDIFKPWAMKDKRGKLIGFEIDVATRLAQDMGVEVEFVPTPWSGIIPALLTGKFDIIIGGLGITTKRALKVNFTIPYQYSGMALVAHKEKAKGFTKLEDFNNPQVEIAIKTGTSAGPVVKKFMPQAQVRMFENEAQAYQELRNGNVHAVVESAPRPAYEAYDYPDLLYTPIEGTFAQEPIAFALRKGDPDALTFFNTWITLMESDGWLQERHHYWFNTKDWAELVE